MMKEFEIDCSKCCALCCVALFYAKTDGFPCDKEAGTPCKNIMDSFFCGIHNELARKKLKGCMAYDCLGAGQRVAQEVYSGEDWRKNPAIRNEMFEVFHTVFELQQMMFYLSCAKEIAPSIKAKAQELIDENHRITSKTPQYILSYDIEQYRQRANALIKQAARFEDLSTKKVDFIGKNLENTDISQKDLSFCLLIAANLKNCKMKGINLLAADMRDADIRNADLSESLFLTQMQVNSALGNENTKLPYYISRPEKWKAANKGE